MPSVPRRQVAYATLDDVVADARRLAEAQAATTGGWSLGQIVQHLAMAVTASVDGFGYQASLPMRLFGRLVVKRWIFARGMPAGVKLPAGAAPALLPPEIDADEAVANLEQAIAYFRAADQLAPHPVLGPLTPEETNTLHRRHAELHLSFVAEPSGP